MTEKFVPYASAREKILEALLEETAKQLSTWARASITGGWSTHQVRPMREWEEKIWAALGRKS